MFNRKKISFYVYILFIFLFKIISDAANTIYKHPVSILDSYNECDEESFKNIKPLSDDEIRDRMY